MICFFLRFWLLSIFDKFLRLFDLFVYKVVLFQLAAKDVPEPAAPAVAPVDDDDTGSGAGSTGRKAWWNGALVQLMDEVVEIEVLRVGWLRYWLNM